MQERHVLKAEPRTIVGKNVKTLRRAGQTPGVIYGPVVEQPVNVTIEAKELERMYYRYGPTTLIDLRVGRKKYVVYMRKVDMNRLKRIPNHAEFFAPNLRVPITTSIAVLLIGESPNERGIVTHGREVVEVRGLPEELPSSIEVDISGLEEFDQAIYLRDVTLPEGIELLTDLDEMLVKLNAPSVTEEVEEEAEEAEEAAEAEAAAEGEEAEAESGEEESGE